MNRNIIFFKSLLRYTNTSTNTQINRRPARGPSTCPWHVTIQIKLSCDFMASRYLHQIKDFYYFKLFHSFEVLQTHFDPPIVPLNIRLQFLLFNIDRRARFEEHEVL